MCTQLVGSFVFGVVAAVYGNIITPGSGAKMDWHLLYTGGHAFAMFVALLGWLWFNLALLGADEDVMRFADNNHCRAFVRKARLEAYAKTVMNDAESAKSAKKVMAELGIDP